LNPLGLFGKYKSLREQAETNQVVADTNAQ